jgi:hypothetical protein
VKCDGRRRGVSQKYAKYSKALSYGMMIKDVDEDGRLYD